MIDIEEMTNKIIEEKNNIIARAFTFQIGKLLTNNGIVPIMKEYTQKDIDTITDTDRYEVVMKYGVSFDELDTTEHDKQVRADTIKEFVEKINEYCSMSDMNRKMISQIAEKLKEHK